MRAWDAARIAAAAGARLILAPEGARGGDGRPGPASVAIDSRVVGEGALFVGLPGERTDGSAHAVAALDAGAWGVLVTEARAQEAADAARAAGGAQAVLAHPDPGEGLRALATRWRERLQDAGTQVAAITGSTGKTSTKEILAALLARVGRTASTPANLNTEIGLPLAILAAPEDTEFLVLELAMRGPGQIAQLARIADPDVGVIVNVGPAHLELLGSLEAIAAAKAELIATVRPGAAVVVPAREPLLERHLRGDTTTVTFGEGGDVHLAQGAPLDQGTVAIGVRGGETVELRPSFREAHNLANLLAAVAAAGALGVEVAPGALEVRFSGGRGERLHTGAGFEVIDDSYNANPMSMAAALDELSLGAPGRRVAVLGDMLELGEQGQRLHAEIGERASAAGVELLIAVGTLASFIAASFAGESHSVTDSEQAAALACELVRPGDVVLVKGSRGVGLERVVGALVGAEAPAVAPGGGRR